MFEQVFGDVRSQISERLSNPLAGSFFLSWCAWNYRFFVVLFSKEDVVSTFNLIETIVFPDVHSVMFKGLVFPAITAAVYIFLYPYPARFVYKFSRNRQREIAEIKRVIEEETPLTIEDSRRIRAELARVESEYAQQLDRKDREIERLKSLTINSEETSQGFAREDIATSKVALVDEGQLNMLLAVEKDHGSASETRLVKDSGVSRIKTEYDLGELVNKGLLEREYDRSAGGYVYKFTHAGRSCVLANS